MTDTSTWKHNADIDVTGIDPARLLMELHNGTTSPDTWACNLHALHRDITLEEAAEVLDAEAAGGLGNFPDYLFGRPIKAFLQPDASGDEVWLRRGDLYDRDSHPGNAAAIVARLRAEGGEA